MQKNASLSGNSSVSFRVPRQRNLVIVVNLEGYASNSLATQPVPDVGKHALYKFFIVLSICLENLFTLYLIKRQDPVSILYSPKSTNFTVSLNPSSNIGSGSGAQSLSYKLLFPSDALDMSENGTVLLSFTGIDPTASLVGVPDLIALPENTTQNQVNLDSLALAEIVLTDALSGSKIPLKKQVELQLTLNPDLLASPGDKIGAWYFNESLGIWIQEGFGVVREVDGALVWTYNASHFSWWNCDRPWYDKHCVHVLVVDTKRTPLIGIDVVLTGKDFIFTDKRKTTSRGVCFDYKKDGTVYLFADAEDQGYYSTTRSVRQKREAATCARYES